MKHARRCPALYRINEPRRCAKPAGHDGPHMAGDWVWTFAKGSSYSLAPSHPEYDLAVGAKPAWKIP